MITPTQYAIFGSQDSDDLDVMYFLDELPSLQECKQLATQLEASHESTKPVDVNLCVVKDQRVVKTYKGTIDEVNNMLTYTVGNHKQPSQFPETIRMERNVPLKVARVLRGILSFISRTEYRPLIKQALRGDGWTKLNTLHCIKLESITDLGDKNKTMQDFYKLFAFQVGQAMGLMRGAEFYSKKSIATQYPLLKPYLYREEDSFPGIDYVKDEFIERVKEVCSLADIHE
jgi:hypothetical protein